MNPQINHVAMVAKLCEVGSVLCAGARCTVESTPAGLWGLFVDGNCVYSLTSSLWSATLSRCEGAVALVDTLGTMRVVPTWNVSRRWAFRQHVDYSMRVVPSDDGEWVAVARPESPWELWHRRGGHVLLPGGDAPRISCSVYGYVELAFRNATYRAAARSDGRVVAWFAVGRAGCGVVRAAFHPTLGGGSGGGGGSTGG